MVGDRPNPSEGQTGERAERVLRYLTADDIIAAADLDERDVYVPQWDGTVTIRGFSKARQQELRKRATIDGEVDTDRLEVFLFIEGVVDRETKEPLFTAEHYEQLRNKNAAAVDIVLRQITEASGNAPADPQRGLRSSDDEAARTFSP